MMRRRSASTPAASSTYSTEAQFATATSDSVLPWATAIRPASARVSWKIGSPACAWASARPTRTATRPSSPRSTRRSSSSRAWVYQRTASNGASAASAASPAARAYGGRGRCRRAWSRPASGGRAPRPSRRLLLPSPPGRARSGGACVAARRPRSWARVWDTRAWTKRYRPGVSACSSMSPAAATPSSTSSSRSSSVAVTAVSTSRSKSWPITAAADDSGERLVAETSHPVGDHLANAARQLEPADVGGDAVPAVLAHLESAGVGKVAEQLDGEERVAVGLTRRTRCADAGHALPAVHARTAAAMSSTTSTSARRERSMRTHPSIAAGRRAGTPPGGPGSARSRDRCDHGDAAAAPTRRRRGGARR